MVGCAVFGKQCACGATRGWRETGSPAATTCFFLFCHAGGLAPAALHIVGYHNIHMVGALHAAPAQAPPPQNNAPAALHRVGGETMAPTRGAYISFVLPCGWVWRLRRDILLVVAYGKTMRLRRYILLVNTIASSPRTFLRVWAGCTPTNRVPLLVGLTTMASSSMTASGAMVGYGKQKACGRHWLPPTMCSAAGAKPTRMAKQKKYVVAAGDLVFPPTMCSAAGALFLWWRGLVRALHAAPLPRPVNNM